VVGELENGSRMVTLAKWRDGAITEEYIWLWWATIGGCREPIVTRPNPGPSLSSARTAPSIHVRAALTWLDLSPRRHRHHGDGPVHRGRDPVLRAFVLTLVVVPLAVYVVVPWLTNIYDRYLAPRR
jgi:multisubunit Na+/H+ antiporter MnhC subunit